MRRKGRLLVLAILLALLGLLPNGATYSTFGATTANGSNSALSGSVVLTTARP